MGRHARTRTENNPSRPHQPRGDIRERLNVSGFRKEIDHALERIAAIKKHLGLDK
jgi:hypothetical protein